jgi:hypothetical protein
MRFSLSMDKSTFDANFQILTQKQYSEDHQLIRLFTEEKKPLLGFQVAPLQQKHPKFNFESAVLSLPNRKDLTILDEIVQDCLDLYSLHLKRFKTQSSACDGNIFVYNLFSEFALLAYFDNRPEQKLETSYFYRFSSRCSRVLTQRGTGTTTTFPSNKRKTLHGSTPTRGSLSNLVCQ